MTVLETERLRLRRLVPDDLDALGHLLDDAEVMRYFSTKAAQLDATRRWMDLYDVQGFGMLAAEFKADHTFVGRVGFAMQTVEDREEVEIGWMIARDHWGRGLATEAARALLAYGFAWHRFPRLISLIDPRNAASIAVARHIGMTLDRDVYMAEWQKHVHVFARRCP